MESLKDIVGVTFQLMARSAVSIIHDLLNRPENALCADCQKKVPKWASTNLGVFICIDCSGIHRSLGTHISFVRSCTLDEWSPEQAHFMESVGNAVANAYWEANLPPDFVRPEPTATYDMINFIKQKYAAKKWAAPGDPPGRVAPAPVVEEPRVKRRRTPKPPQVVSSKSTELISTRADDVSLDEILGERARPVARQKDQVSSAARKPGRKLPARLARKMKAAEDIPSRRQNRPPPTAYSEPNLAQLQGSDDDDEDPFA